MGNRESDAMKSLGLWLAMSGVAVVMAATACFLALAAWTDNRALQREIADLQQERRAAIEGSLESERHRRTAEEALTLEREQSVLMQAELAELRAQPSVTAPAAPLEERRAIRARVYAGRQALGDAWILQGGTATDEAGLRAAPAVLLDESILRVFRAAVARAEPVQAAPREVTVNYNYPAQTPHAGWYPTWYVLPIAPTNGPPSDGAPQEPPSTTPPRDDSLSSSGIWRPTQQPFLPNPSPWPIATPPRATRSVAQPSVNQPSVSRPSVTQPIFRPPATQPVARPPAIQPRPQPPRVQPTSPVTLPSR
jgi:hypothetical protein